MWVWLDADLVEEVFLTGLESLGCQLSKGW